MTLGARHSQTVGARGRASACLARFRRLLCAACGIAGAVGAGAGPFAAIDDEILVVDWVPLEPAFEDLSGAGGITRLGGKRGARDMRRGWSLGAGCGNHTIARIAGRSRIFPRRLGCGANCETRDYADTLGKGDEIMSGMTAFAGVSDDSIEPIETFR
jgi:hypothetical protein